MGRCLFCITGNAEKFTECLKLRRTVAFLHFFHFFTFYSTGFGTEGMYNEAVTKHFQRFVPENDTSADQFDLRQAKGNNA